ncbi:type II toxin-antitoxin system VapC family toxin [bacterium]|nr:type II toxin-antitoxin system VapC family toxin [bacterium]
MKNELFLFDTHALLFWTNRELVSNEYIDFFDQQDLKANIRVSSITFWEIALLAKKGKIEIEDTYRWSIELVNNTNIQIIDPTYKEMIDSTLLPDHHKDPFDRLLISQTVNRQLKLVTKDESIKQYDVPVFWR